MEVSVETTSDLGRQMNIQVPAEVIEEKYNERIAAVSKTAKIDGFRPGKVPARVLKMRYGHAVRQEILD